MKLRKFTLLLIFSFGVLNLFGQSPTNIEVEYQPFNDGYIISFNHVDSAIEYRLYTYDKYDVYKLPPIKTTKDTFFQTWEIPELFPMSDKDSVIYFAIEAKRRINGVYDSTHNNIDLKPGKNAPSNIIIKQKNYDPCTDVLTLEWNKYYYPDSNKNTYYLYYFDSDGNRSPVVGMDHQKSTYDLDLDVYAYKYVVKDAITLRLEVKNSDQTVVRTHKFKFPRPQNVPSNIKPLRAYHWNKDPESIWTIDDMNEKMYSILKVDFEINPLTTIDSFRLLYHDDTQLGTYSRKYTTPKLQDSSVITIQDPDISGKNNKVRFYKLADVSSCPEKPSQSIGNIYLKVELSPSAFSLISEGNIQKNKSLNAYRVREGKIPQLLETAYQDKYDNSLNPGETVCFYLEAIDNSNCFVRSNLACATYIDQTQLDEILRLDNCTESEHPFMFTQDQKKMSTIAKYTMIIYDRWGTKVWETTSIEEGWNGKSSSGATVPEGAYIYYIKYETITGASATRRGTIAVLCP